MRQLAALWRMLAFPEDGSAMVELIVAMSVLSVAVIGVVGTMALGAALTGGARQRSSASAVANERLERARNLTCSGTQAAVCYSHVAIGDPVAHSTDPGSPDYSVTTDNTSYTLKGGTIEPLIVDTGSGGLKHIDDPIRVGNTQFSIHQYVTWVHDLNIPSTACPLPSTGTHCDYKRVTVVVTWKYPVASGIAHSLTESSFVSNGTVPLLGVTPTPPSATSTPTPSATPTPTPTPAPSCPGDVTAPTGSIAPLSGAGAQAGFTNSNSESVQLTATDPCSPITAWLSNTNGNFSNVTTLTSGVASTVTWTLTSGDGPKTIYAQFHDGAGNLSVVYTAAITLDQTVPDPVPASLRNGTGSPSKSGSNCVFTLNWNASADTNFVGYQVWKQVNGGPLGQLDTTSGLSYQDTTAKSDAYAYTVRAYDKAGNTTVDSNVQSYAKNSC